VTGSLGRTVHQAGILALLILVLLWPSAHPIAPEAVALSEIQSIGQTEWGVGAAFDGSHVWYTLGYASDTNVYRIDPGTDTVVASLDMVALTGGRNIVPGGLAWDSNSQHLWVGTLIDMDATGSFGDGEIFEIDPVQGVMVSSFPTSSLTTSDADPVRRMIDGLAFDARSDTLWFSPLEAGHVYQVTTEGILVSSFALPFPSALWGAGVTFDGNHLWLSLRTGGITRDTLSGFSEISLAEFTPAGDLLRLRGFPSVNPRGSEDLAFDPVTFAPQCVVWLTSIAATLTPLEVPCSLQVEATMGPGETLDLEVDVVLDHLAAGGIEGPTADVWWEVECGAPDITITLQPEMVVDAEVGGNLLFGETIGVSGDAVAGDYHCTVTFLVDPGTGEGAPFEQQTIWITVEPPEEIPQELPEQLPYVEVSVDIKPGSCRNPLNVKSQGVLPVAILGTADFDVSQIDFGTIEVYLEGEDEVELVSATPLRGAMEDVATAYESSTDEGDATDCNEQGPDGYVDLMLKFDTQEVVALLVDVSDGDVLYLGFHGMLLDGTTFEGGDSVEILKKGKK
jgi:hypothetical protein